MFTGGPPDQKFYGLEDLDNDMGFALDLYAYANQGYYGDQVGEAPPWWEVEPFAKWHAWNGVRGMPRHEAAHKFLEIAEPFIRRKGYETEHPYRQTAEREYEECIEQKI